MGEPFPTSLQTFSLAMYWRTDASGELYWSKVTSTEPPGETTPSRTFRTSPGFTLVTVTRFGAAIVPRSAVTWLPAATCCATLPLASVTPVVMSAPVASLKTTVTPISGPLAPMTSTSTT